MAVNYFAILIASVLQFLVGFVWYTPLFGKLWGKMHGFDLVPKEQQDKMMKSMGPLLAVQFMSTVVTTVVLALFIGGLQSLSWNPYGIAFFMWLGFVVPTQIAAVIFGGTKPEWVVKKILVMAGASLICLMVAAAVLHYMPAV